MAEDMDINCAVILKGTPLEPVGRQIFEEIVAVASGKRRTSELSGVRRVGEEACEWRVAQGNWRVRATRRTAFRLSARAASPVLSSSVYF